MFPIKVKSLASFLGQVSHSEKMLLGACFDSRKTKPGDLFFALPGNRVDGHLFLRDAAAKGAAAAIVSKDYLGEDFGLELIRADKVLTALYDLGGKALELHHPKIVGITGSLGKTTTKDFATVLLRSKYQVDATVGSENSQLGLPLTIMNRKGREEILVLEMGMTLPGQIAKLVQLAPPDIAVITTVALVHACSFENIEAIAKAKAEIFSHPATRLGIYNANMPGKEIAQNTGSCKKMTFAYGEENGDYCLHYETAEAGIRVRIRYQGAEVMQTGWELPGLHNLQNYLAAVSIAHQMGVSWEEIKAATSKLSLPAMRLQKIEKKGVIFINDAYNANQNSMCAALASLPQPVCGKKRVAVLGNMPELGHFSEECHKTVGKFALNHVERLFCLGKECAPMINCWHRANKPADLMQSLEELVDRLRDEVEPGDVVLLKGANMLRLWEVIDYF